MEYTPVDFRSRYPEFGDTVEYTSARIELFIEDAQDDIGKDEGHWGGEVRYKRALGALTAHLLVFGTNSEAGDVNPLQVVASKEAGDVKIAHVQNSSINPKSIFESNLQTTTYGRNFLALRRRTFVGTLVV